MSKADDLYAEEMERYCQEQDVYLLLKTIRHIIYFYEFSSNELFLVANALKNISFALRDSFENDRKRYKKIENYITERLEECS